MSDSDGVTRLRGPVERVDAKLVLRIPLEAGGSDFIACSKGISAVEGDYLQIEIPEWLSGMLRIDAGSLVSVDNANGKLNIHPIDPEPLQ